MLSRKGKTSVFLSHCIIKQGVNNTGGRVAQNLQPELGNDELWAKPRKCWFVLPNHLHFAWKTFMQLTVDEERFYVDQYITI